MPAWLITVLVLTAKALGPLGLQFLVTKFPWIPQAVVTEIEALLNSLAAANKAHAENKAALVAQAKANALDAVKK